MLVEIMYDDASRTEAYLFWSEGMGSSPPTGLRLRGICRSPLLPYEILVDFFGSRLLKCREIDSDLAMGSPVFIYGCMGFGCPFNLDLLDKMNTDFILKQGELPR